MSQPRAFFIGLARVAVAAIFLGACLTKIRDPESFALAVQRYRLLPGAFINVVAIILPWIELTAGVAVLVGPPRWRAGGAAIIAGMLVVFTGAISLNVLRGIEASCGCFSTRADAAVSDAWNLVRNAALIWLAGAILVAGWRQTAQQDSS